MTDLLDFDNIEGWESKLTAASSALSCAPLMETLANAQIPCSGDAVGLLRGLPALEREPLVYVVLAWLNARGTWK
ncbi:MAG: hypothetical protein GX604_02505 [Actinobacteria bacterium]|nr:hypothetical protein [Actinomycetota bacterium]